jgi:NADH:ubiquinone oxidoreductase subunit E
MARSRSSPSKEELFLCMGSACHQLGVYDVLPELQRLIHEYGMEPTVELKGAFCLDCCADGISMRHRDRVFQRINPRNVRARFVEEILPSLQQYASGSQT